jgi:hypothetical protein
MSEGDLPLTREEKRRCMMGWDNNAEDNGSLYTPYVPTIGKEHVKSCGGNVDMRGYDLVICG